MKVVFTLFCYMSCLVRLLSQEKSEDLLSELEVLENVITTNKYYYSTASILDNTSTIQSSDWFLGFTQHIKNNPKDIKRILSDQNIDDRIKQLTLFSTKMFGPEFFIEQMNEAIILVQEKRLNADVFKYSYIPLFTDFEHIYLLNYKDERIQILMTNIEITFKDKDKKTSDFAIRIKNGEAYNKFIQNQKDLYGDNWRTKISTNLLYKPDIIEPEFSPEMLKLIQEAESAKNSNTNGLSTSTQTQPTETVTLSSQTTIEPEPTAPDEIHGLTKRNWMSVLMIAGGSALVVMTLLYAFWPKGK